MTRALRDYQNEAVEAIREEWSAGVTRTAAVMATGLGKTDVIAKVVTDHAAEGGRPLVMAHREELLNQITARCGMHSALPVGRIQGATSVTTMPITVASSPTLARRVSRLGAAQTPRERFIAESLLPHAPTMIVVDECHHASAPSQTAILSWAGAFDHVPTLGVTATLVRGDKRGLGDVWQSLAFERGIEWAIANGWLVRPHGRVVVISHLDLDGAKVTGGDYQDNELGEMVAQDVDQIVESWLKHADNRITAAFTPTVESAELLAAEFCRAGVAAEVVTGTTTSAERGDVEQGTGIYGRLARGETRVLCGVMVTTEGWDCPPVSCVLMARPTRLPGLYQQIVGRGLRTSPGKTDCLVLDVVGASRYQRLTSLVDLLPSAEVNRDELDALPCEVCGALRDECACQPEERERDPDRGLIRLPGPPEYEDVDLFATSRAAWLFTRAGKRFLPAGDRTAVLWPLADDLFRVGHVANRGRLDGVRLGDGLTLDEARQLAESWALARDPSIATRAAPWRKRGGPPSPAQLDRARGLGIVNPEQYDKTRLSDELSIAITSRRLD